jgi:hypothetical protein
MISEARAGHISQRNQRRRVGPERAGDFGLRAESIRPTRAAIPSPCPKLRLDLEPSTYLQEVLTRLPTTPAGQLGDLLPDHWQAARQATIRTLLMPVTNPGAPAVESTF